ncbi:MAG: hypothetical protein KC461_01935, partial [Dehalococcoidia bacterium]|nr:hypothetical protein [Dehalococcoidia bacterium]
MGPRLIASGNAFRFAARLLPRAGSLQRALLNPTYGDPSGHVLGDPVRPFMRWRRRYFPVALQSLSTMRAVAARGRNATSEDARLADRASHLTAQI